MAATWRATQKANRRAALMRASAHLFAERGYKNVSTIELGEAVGMSGPALYNYFPSKEALLCELLIDVSTRLLAGCLEIVGDERSAEETLDELIVFHAEFATAEPDIILLQDRELSRRANLAAPASSGRTGRSATAWGALQPASSTVPLAASHAGELSSLASVLDRERGPADAVDRQV